MPGWRSWGHTATVWAGFAVALPWMPWKSEASRVRIACVEPSMMCPCRCLLRSSSFWSHPRDSLGCDVCFFRTFAAAREGHQISLGCIESSNELKIRHSRSRNSNNSSVADQASSHWRAKVMPAKLRNSQVTAGSAKCASPCVVCDSCSLWCQLGHCTATDSQ